ncbi:sulfotransferase 6B1-like [Neoarius graeffei]|uniref:sulfotransferase 6B1-like n=1 Tax=Neoarius graeffei TaxID=443677 RepID=UPI00298C6F68|nr:sulfotransferase 6B1-like [Neoarius graeffei]
MSGQTFESSAKSKMEQGMNMKDEEKIYRRNGILYSQISCYDCSMLVIFRNPKDTAVSYYHFMNNNPVLPKAESWDKFFSDFMSGEVGWGSYFDHAVAWDKQMDNPNVLIATYEELKEVS